VTYYHDSGPVPHICPPLPDWAGAVVTCGVCRKQRRRYADGTWIEYPYGPSFPTVPLAPHTCPDPPPVPEGSAGTVMFCAPCRTWRKRDRYGAITAEPASGLQDGGVVVHAVTAPAEPAGPARGSAQWWAAATREDLEPGWWGQPDPPQDVAYRNGCRECRLPWPPPDGSGLCRYCRLAAAERPPGRPAAIVLLPRPVPARRSPVMAVAAMLWLALRVLGYVTAIYLSLDLAVWVLRALLG
jgi:hypothetical protein